jgi:hypothetical protein
VAIAIGVIFLVFVVVTIVVVRQSDQELQRAIESR